MASPSKRKFQSVLIEVLIWAVLGTLMFLYIPLSWGVQLPVQFWIKQTAIFLMVLLVYYANFTILVPQLLFKNKNGLFLLSLILLSAFYVSFLEYFDEVLQLRELMDRTLKVEGHVPPPRNRGLFNPFNLVISVLVLGVSTSIALTRKWQKDNQLRILLEQEKTSSELSYLKAQINPHFFFNTLNNIYALMHVDIESSKVALHKLSRMMRYLLYETQNEHTLLSKEVAFITDFIQLMQLRLTASTEVTYTAPEIENDFTVSPMLFLPFIENAFKHGIRPGENSRIEIEIQVNGSTTTLTVENSFFVNADEVSETRDKGIGLINTKRRLDLLYPEKHKLNVMKDFSRGIYRVQLEIDFS